MLVEAFIISGEVEKYNNQIWIISSPSINLLVTMRHCNYTKACFT